MDNGLEVKMQYWNWNKQIDIVLYGVNRYSQQLADTFCDNGYQVLAYLDRRADELVKVNGIDVYDMESFSYKGKEICVIIMLQNAMQHDEIAQELFKKGVEKIVFVPMSFKYKGKYTGDIIKAYNNIIQGNFEEIEIPYYKTLIQDSNMRPREKFYTEDKNYVTILVSADILYTAIIEPEPYADVPLSAFKPYDQMFKYFLPDGAGDIKEYLEKFGVNSCNYTNSFTNDRIILQREQLYEIWNEHFQEGIDFFVSSAPGARWNSSGYFNLMEGQHRSLFLLKKGIYYLPVQISKDDYEKWKNNDWLEKLNLDDKLVDIECPIQNPYFHNQSFYNKISVIESMLQIQQNLSASIYKNKKLLSMDSMYGYYGFHLRRMGGKSVTLLVKNDKERNIAESLLDLYRLHDVDIQSDSQTVEFNRFSFVLLIGSNDEISHHKYTLLNSFEKLEIEAVLFSLTDAEKESVDELVKERMIYVSKVFLKDRMTEIFLLRRNN